MADANVGGIVGTLRIDTTQWQQGLRQAEQQLAQFAGQITRLTSQLNQFGNAFQQAFTQNQQALSALPQRTQQASQSFQQFNTQIHQTNQAFTAVNHTVQQFNTHLASTTNNVNNVRQGLQQAQGAASGFGSILQGALSVAGGLGIVTSISGIVAGLKTLATEAVQATARMEQLRAQFTALQGAAQAAVTLSNLFNTAQRLGVEFGTLAGAFRQFMAATQGTVLEGAKAERLFEQLVTGMKAMGASTEQQSRGLLAFQQMISKGIVSQEELRGQLAEAIPGAAQIAARALGVTTQELNKMIEKGMDAVTFAQAFGNQFQQEFGSKAAAATNTLTSAWQRFSNELEQFKGALAGEELIGRLRELANWAARFLETLRKAREEREGELGGPAVVIPEEMRGMRTLTARQEEIDKLRRFARGDIQALTAREAAGYEIERFGAFPSDKAIEQAKVKLRELQDVQRAAIKRMQEQWAAEGPTPGEGMVPGARQAEAIRKRYEEGLKELTQIDATAAFVPPLELADQKAKAWHKTMQDIREITGQIGVGLRSTLTPTGKTTPFDDLITRIAAEKGIDPNLGRALIEQESGFNPRAVSRAGAKGLTQLMPGTAREMGVPAGKEFDPEENIRGGFAYLAKMIQLAGGNIERALTMYNAGPRGGGIPQATGENATFARDVLRRMPPGTGGVSGGVGGNVGDVLASGERLQKSLDISKELLVTDQQRAGNLRQQVENMEQVISRQKAQLIAQREGQEAAERFTRLDQARLQNAQTEERLARVGLTVGQLKIRDQERLVALQEESAQLSAQQEALRVEAMRPQLTTQLQGIQAFLGRPDQSLAEQARQQVLRQGAATEADIIKTLRELARHPALQDLQEAFQNALQALPEAVERQSEEAFAAVERQARETLRGMEDQLDQISLRMGTAGLSPFEADLARIRREAARTTDQLEAMVAALGKLRIGATPETQQTIDVMVGRIKDVQAGQGKALTDALLERQERDGKRLIEQAESRLAQMREPPGTQGFPFGPPREVTQLRREAAKADMTDEQRETLRLTEEQMIAQDRLNFAVGIWYDLSQSIGQAWSQSLMSVIDGTMSVSQAFEAMGKAILKTMADIAAQQATMALFQLGAGLLTAGLTGGMGAGMGAGSGPSGLGTSSGFIGTMLAPQAGFAFGGAQHGMGPINSPTNVLVGEGRTNPEWILNNAQLQSVMTSAVRSGTSGSQGQSPVSIHNYPSKAAAEAGAAQQRAQGGVAVVNAVLDELSTGESSRINRALRSLQR